MENKSSSGYDGISNKMLKYIKKEISNNNNNNNNIYLKSNIQCT